MNDKSCYSFSGGWSTDFETLFKCNALTEGQRLRIERHIGRHDDFQLVAHPDVRKMKGHLDMHAARLALAVFALTLFAAPAEAATGFHSKVCVLVTAKQTATVRGLSTKCTNAPSSQGPGSTIYVGNWAGKTPTSSHLQVTVSVYNDTGMFQLATRNLRQGLPGGPAKRVAGIGGAAYEATGAGSAGIHFTVGKDVVAIVLTASSSTASLESIAKTIAAELR